MIEKKLVKHNTYEYNLLKASEELQELSLILLQKINKPQKVKNSAIIDEIGDVDIRLRVLKEMFSKKAVKRRIKDKEAKFEEYQKKYDNV